MLARMGKSSLTPLVDEEIPGRKKAARDDYGDL
jgi:hypothetical protein